MIIEIKVEKTVIPRSAKAPGSTLSRTRYVGILLRDGVEIYRSKPRPYVSCARAMAAQERADREKRGEL